MEFKRQLAAFISDNKIVGTVAGVTIALVSKDVILSLVADVVLPVILIILLKFKFTAITNFLDAKHKGVLNVTKFISTFISWLLALIITYLFVQYAFIQFIGVSMAAKGHDVQKKQNDAANNSVGIEGFKLF
jgi:large-conductance mechanosensitive channel